MSLNPDQPLAYRSRIYWPQGSPVKSVKRSGTVEAVLCGVTVVVSAYSDGNPGAAGWHVTARLPGGGATRHASGHHGGQASAMETLRVLVRDIVHDIRTLQGKEATRRVSSPPGS